MRSNSHSIIRNALRSIAGWATLANGKIWVGDSSGIAQERTPGGEATISNTGSVTIATTHSGSAHHTQGTDTALGTQAEALDMGTYKVTNMGDPTDLQDSVTLKTLLESANISLNYWLAASNVLSQSVTVSAAFLNETVSSSPQALTTCYFKSAVAATPTPFTIKSGTTILVDTCAKVDGVSAGKRILTLTCQIGYVDADGTSNFVQIGANSQASGSLTVSEVNYQLRISVSADTVVPAGKRLWLKYIATTVSGTNNTVVYVEYDDTDDHVTIPVAGSVLGRYLLLSGGTMSGAIAMGTNKVTGLAAATANGDAVRFEQIPTVPTVATNAEALTGTDTAKIISADDLTYVLKNVSLRDTYRGLLALVNSTHTDHQVDLTIDEIILHDVNSWPKAIRSVSVTVDLAASGANGLDTGSEASSTWYYLWVLAKADGTVCGVFSASSTAPTFPSGYTFKALVGAWKNDVSSNLVNQIQVDRLCSRLGGAAAQVVASGSQTTYTAVDCSALIPPTARAIGGYGASYTNDASFYVAATASGLGAQQNYIPSSWGFISFVIACPTAQNFYYRVDAGGAANVYVTSWYY